MGNYTVGRSPVGFGMRLGLSMAALALTLGALPAATRAATWTGSIDANWNTIGNWTSNPAGVADTVNTATGNFPVIGSAPTFTPVDLFVGTGAGAEGRLDQTTGTLALANTGVNGNWMFVGTATGTGTYNLTGDGSLAVGKLWIGGQVYGENGTGTVTVNTTGTLQANSTDDFSGWGQYQTSLSVGWGSFPSGPANGTLNLVQGTINTPNRAIYVGAWGSTGTVNQGGGTINANGLAIGRWFSTLATVNVTGGTLNTAFVTLAQTGNGGDVSHAVLNVSGSGVLNSEGDLAVAVGGSGAGGGYGQVNIGAGGTVNVASTVERWMIVNQFDTTPGTVNVTGGTLNLNAGTDLRYSTGNSTGAGTVNLTSGAITGGAGSVVDLNRSVADGANNVFNLDGGTLTIGQVITTNDGSTAAFNFNGGTLKAAGSNTSFLTLGGASQTANVLAGGAVIDTNGSAVTIAQPLLDAGGGGLTKTGAGILTLTGANTYSGPTTVTSGSLMVGTASLATGSYSATNGTALGVVVASQNAQLTTSAITMSGSCGLSFDLGSFANPTVAPMLTFGLTTNGAVAVNVAGDRLGLGQFPLLQYGSRSGTGSYAIGTLPQGVTATLVDNVAGQTIDLLITALASRVWSGSVTGTPNGQWSTGPTQNWLIPPSTPVAFASGDAALYDDTAAGTTNITVVGTVSPSSVMFDNSALAYTVSGSGAIAGAIDVTKRGAANVTVSSPNTYTGITRVEAGRLAVTSVANGGAASPLGAASAAASNLLITAGTFAYVGSTASTDRGFTISGTAPSTIEVSGTSTTLTVAGLATVSGTGRLLKEGDGTLRLTGSANALSAAGLGAAVNAGRLELVGTGSDATSNVTTVSGEMAIGNVPGTGGSLAMTNATLTMDWFFSVGRGTGAVGASSEATLTNSRLSCTNIAMGYDNCFAGNSGSQSLKLVVYTLSN
ncbi:MAG: beta strand repeat-containing protein, partial [Pirellulales bacterium]